MKKRQLLHLAALAATLFLAGHAQAQDFPPKKPVTLVVGFATNIARAEHAVRQAERQSGMTDLEWWEDNAEELGRVMAAREYPIAGRVGSAAGEAYQAGTDPRRELEFGLARILDGIEAHLSR